MSLFFHKGKIDFKSRQFCPFLFEYSSHISLAESNSRGKLSIYIGLNLNAANARHQFTLLGEYEVINRGAPCGVKHQATLSFGWLLGKKPDLFIFILFFLHVYLKKFKPWVSAGFYQSHVTFRVQRTQHRLECLHHSCWNIWRFFGTCKCKREKSEKTRNWKSSIRRWMDSSRKFLIGSVLETYCLLRLTAYYWNLHHCRWCVECIYLYRRSKSFTEKINKTLELQLFTNVL